MSKAEATIWEHLEELVVRLRRALFALFLASILVPLLPNPLTLIESNEYSPLLVSVHEFVRDYVIPDTITLGDKTIEVKLITRDPFAGIKLTLYTMLLIGVIVAGPYMAYEIYAYLKPALYPHEERALKWGALASAGLFILGALISIFLLLPITYRIMFTMTYLLAGELQAFADYLDLFQSAVLITLATGIAFQVPLIVFILVYYDVVKLSIVSRPMRYALVASAIAAAILSPDPSGIGMLVLLVPYFSLVVLAVALANWMKKSRRR